jgi:hypothetical protein
MLSRARCRTDPGNGTVPALRHKPIVRLNPSTTGAQRSHSAQCASIAAHDVASSSPSRKAEMFARIAAHS